MMGVTKSVFTLDGKEYRVETCGGNKPGRGCYIYEQGARDPVFFIGVDPDRGGCSLECTTFDNLLHAHSSANPVIIIETPSGTSEEAANNRKELAKKQYALVLRQSLDEPVYTDGKYRLLSKGERAFFSPLLSVRVFDTDELKRFLEAAAPALLQVYPQLWDLDLDDETNRRLKESREHLQRFCKLGPGTIHYMVTYAAGDVDCTMPGGSGCHITLPLPKPSDERDMPPPEPEKQPPEMLP